MTIPGHFLIVGGAGFIGSHFVDKLLTLPNTVQITVFDNFTSGTREHLAAHQSDPRLKILEADAADLTALKNAMRGTQVVIHLASNPDLAKAQSDPDIDFREGTLLTRNVLEAMRDTHCPRLLYASGSGVYGDCGENPLSETHGPLIPVSPYGASKLAGEALISSYCHMFNIKAIVFRFANVIGPRQTHGVGFDFLRRLRKNPTMLSILGDGRQSKPYIYVQDVVEAVWMAYLATPSRYEIFNIGTEDAITVTEIAKMACETLQLSPDSTTFQFSGGRGGWKGDVPVVRLNNTKIQSLGWRPRYTSQEAMRLALEAMKESPL